jgi:hypothetical protein
MNGKLFFCVSAVAFLLCAADRAQAQYYNDDYITLPNGPIELENATASYSTNQWTLSGDAVNLTSQTYTDVKYLDEWVFDTAPTAFTYQGSDLWTGDSHFWSVLSPAGYLLASDVSPLPYADTPQAFSAPTAYVAPTDLLPYTNVGTIGPFASVPFSFTVAVDTDFDFAFDSSFVSTTVPVTPTPEPSTFVLLAIGATVCGGLLYRRRRAIA